MSVRIFLIAMLTTAGMAAASVLAGERISVAGSTTVLPIVAQAAKAYRAMHPDVVLTVAGGGSGVGIAGVRGGTLDLGMASRALTEDERHALTGRVEVVPVARDAVAVVVSRAVYLGGVRRLSLAQVAAIYRGGIRNWREVGGPDRRILVLDKAPSRGTRHVFARVVLGDAHARAPGASIIVGSNNEEQATVARSDSAIGMLSNAWLNDRVRAVALGTATDAVPPSLAHVADGSYPIQRRLNLLVPREAGAAVRAFVDFLLSPAGQEIVSATGYLPIR